MSQIKCLHCNKFGHFKAQCLERFNDGKKRGNQHATMAKFEEHSKRPKVEGDKDHFYYFAVATSLADENNISLIDSGASRHMTGERDHLTSMMERRLAQKVELGDNESYTVKGIGTTSIELGTGESIHLSNKLYVPGLKKKLVSISCLE